MLTRRTFTAGALATATALALPTFACAAEENSTAILANDALAVKLLGTDACAYVFRDAKIPRPYFQHLAALDGTRVTRNNPPQSGDLTDHDTFHPGLWLAFGDVNKHDFWRNTAGGVKHVRMAGDPKVETTTEGDTTRAKLSFSVEQTYLAKDGKEVARETCAYTIETQPAGWRLLWDSTVAPADGDIAFGDQEEMGLGVRLATPLIVKNGGTIANSNGEQDEKGCWGKRASWCDYSGVIAKKRYGVLLMPHPKNFQPSSFHVRDYGLMVANPFAEQAFGRGAAAKTVVKKGEKLRLRFGLFVYGLADEKALDAGAAYADYLKTNGD